ncbi:MAG: PD-(D/E)XK nuclease family protein [Patescibacteria group bacterium]|nr:PD-(D/E)XK nuclease family protein [Patescibacteria group bacterium]
MTEQIVQKNAYLDHVSFSSMRTFLQCPRKFFGEKLLLDSPKQYSIELLIGSAVHKAWEVFFKNKKNEKKIIFSSIEKIIEQEILEIVEQAKEKDFFQFNKEEIELAKEISTNIIIRNYKNMDFIIGEFAEVFDAELEIKTPIESHPHYFFECHIDLITQMDDVFFIWDYKTVKNFWDITKKNNLKQYTSQLLLYKYFFHKQYNVPPERIRTFFLFFKKTNCTVEKWMSSYTVKDLTTMLDCISSVCNALDSKQFLCNFDPNSSHCKYCQFFSNKECTLMNVDTVKYIQDHYALTKEENHAI